MAQRERIYTNREEKAQLAFNLAEAGLNKVESWFMHLTTATTLGSVNSPEDIFGIDPFTPFPGNRTVDGYDGTYRVFVDPADSNPGQFIREYTVVSTGTADALYLVEKSVEVRYSVIGITTPFTVINQIEWIEGYRTVNY